jgi:purine-binding chemotaxis protein CheW
VIEAMRPLPIEALPGAPDFVLGLAVIRGRPTAVLDLRALLGDGDAAHEPEARFVTVRAGDRQIALSVGAVAGVRALDPSSFGELPPLLKGARRDAIEAIGTLDAELLLVLRASRLVQEAG